MKEKIEILEQFYFRIVDIWQRLCETHSALYEKTCDEYEILLKSDIDALPPCLDEKEAIIKQINQLEQLRQDVIIDINETFSNANIRNVKDLIKLMKNFEVESGNRYLERFNTLLVNIIETLQAQNKKNQVYLNKAIKSLDDLKADISGKGKQYDTYNSHGITKGNP